MHIGSRIKSILNDRGHSVTWFAKKLHTVRGNVYDIFQRESLDTELLLRISVLLRYNFFDELKTTADSTISEAIKDYNNDKYNDGTTRKEIVKK